MGWKSHLQFRVVDGQFELSGTTFSLKRRRLEIGRLPKDCEAEDHEVLFREPTLSRVHATLTWKTLQSSYLLEHKSDVNATLVNGQPIKKMILATGDRVQMGLLTLELEDKRQSLRAPEESRIQLQSRLRAIIADVEQEFSHVTFERRNL